VLVPKDSPIKTLSDLKGKKIAVAKGSSAQNITIKALALAGLTLKDVEPVYLAPADATAAFNGGNVDAWVVWDPFYAIAEQRYNARTIADTSDKRLTSASYYMASREFAVKHPKVLTAIVDEVKNITVKAGQNREELAQIASEATGIDVKVWNAAFKRAEFTVSPVTEAHIAQQQQLADTFQALGIIPKKISVKDIVWRAPGTQ
jgi:sulfonate transport system substrate-binding protein